MKPGYWLCKTEPSTYSFAQLKEDGKTNWDKVRNYQARNFLRQMSLGDSVLIYHSGDDKSVMGIAQVSRRAYTDIDLEGGDWSQVDLKLVKEFKVPVSLKQIKADLKLKGLPLIRHTRLSVMPLSSVEFEHLLKLGGLT